MGVFTLLLSGNPPVWCTSTPLDQCASELPYRPWVTWLPCADAALGDAKQVMRTMFQHIWIVPKNEKSYCASYVKSTFLSCNLTHRIHTIALWAFYKEDGGTSLSNGQSARFGSTYTKIGTYREDGNNNLICETERDTDVQNRLLDSVGEGEGGMFWENSIETSMLSRVKQITSPGWMYDMGAQG